MRALARLLVVFGALAALGCATPTALSVQIDSEVACDAGAKAVLVGGASVPDLASKSPAATSTECVAAGTGEVAMGNVVIVPLTSQNEEVAFAVMLRPDGKSAAGCLDPSEVSDCIVAKRELRFIPHTDLGFRVDLRLACLGVACPGDETCVAGTCTSAVVADPEACQPTCSEGSLLPTDSGAPDAGDAASNAGDAASDAGDAASDAGDAASDAGDASGPRDAASDAQDAARLDASDAASDAGGMNDAAPIDASDAGAPDAADGASPDAGLDSGATSDSPADVADVAELPDATDAAASAEAGSFTLGGTVGGLAPGDSVVLQDNGGDDLVVTVNGSFAFSTSLAPGSAYAVTIGMNPTTPSQTCVVASGVGTVSSTVVTAPTVTCATVAFGVGGTLSGLAAGDSVVLTDNGGDDLTLNANGAFMFATPVLSGQPYRVAVLTNPTAPTAQTCFVLAAAGTIGGASVTNVQVACSNDGPTVLASTQSFAYGVATDGANVYWTDSAVGFVMKEGVDGTGLATLASGLNTPVGIATSGGNVYWADETDGTVLKVAVDGTGLATLASGQDEPFGVATDGASVYWTDLSGSSVMKVAVDGTGLATLASGQGNPLWIATDGANVYWTDTNGTMLVMKVAVDGTGLATLATGQSTPEDIATDGASVYWTEQGAGTVKKVGVDGTGLATLASGQSNPYGIATDGTSVYWTTLSGDTIVTVKNDGTGLATLASGQSQPTCIVTSATSVFWSNSVPNGAVVSAPK